MAGDAQVAMSRAQPADRSATCVRFRTGITLRGVAACVWKGSRPSVDGRPRGGCFAGLGLFAAEDEIDPGEDQT